jgi:hypothetical protein
MASRLFLFLSDFRYSLSSLYRREEDEDEQEHFVAVVVEC